jgi:hypothetical protein
MYVLTGLTPVRDGEWGEAWVLVGMWVGNDLVYLVGGGGGGVRFMMSISRSGG